jgi:hypothetical protein
MSERKTDTSGTGTDSTGTGSTGTGSTGTGSTGSTGRPDRRSQHDQDNDEFQAGTGYQPSTNQARDEPLPASHHDDERQDAGRRRDEPVRDDSPPRTQDGRRETGRGK